MALHELDLLRRGRAQYPGGMTAISPGLSGATPRGNVQTNHLTLKGSQNVAARRAALAPRRGAFRFRDATGGIARGLARPPANGWNASGVLGLTRTGDHVWPSTSWIAAAVAALNIPEG